MKKKERKSNQTIRRHFSLYHWRIVNMFLIAYDILAVNLSFFLALWLRFDCRFSAIPEEYLNAFLYFAPMYTVACIAVFWCLRLYKSIWRFASFNELLRVVCATGITAVVQLLGITLLFQRMPVTYYFTGVLLQFFSVLGIRFMYRFVLLLRAWKDKDTEQVPHRVMLIGAGAAGQMILHDIVRSKEINDRVYCIIDDNRNKWHRFIEGVPVVGGKEDILSNCKKYHIEKIYLAIPSATAEQKRDILQICNETGCELKSLPGTYQITRGQITVQSMKDVAIEDLLGRQPIHVDLDEVFQFISGKTILVTGGGGSIGSELCRQIAAHNPKRLLLLEIYENNAYDIQMELKDKYPELDLVVLIGSVRDSRRVDQIFREYRPDVVYHAAAHKHVPLMEDSPCESIKNNAIGTYKTAYAAMAYGCKRFVLISTDKAVNPTNIMGASKRLCEMIIQSFDRIVKENRTSELPVLFTHGEDGYTNQPHTIPQGAKTEFVAVRFGNVLGSNGSVIPLFKKQIAKGGPVTVTHPDIIRYFMTIPEAVSLVLQAGTYAHGGEIFVLDMGSPVKIDTLARNLIKLCGYKPDVDIMIEYTGLRPGEKLFEEKLMEEEGMRRTQNDLIHIGCPIPFDTDVFLKQLQQLMEASYDNRKDIRRMVADMVLTYHPIQENTRETDDAPVTRLHEPAFARS